MVRVITVVRLDCTQKLHFSLGHRWHFFRQLGATLHHHTASGEPGRRGAAQGQTLLEPSGGRRLQWFSGSGGIVSSFS
jgi:hypothetical protein